MTICPYCDRGQKYCSAECALAARILSQRVSRALYQATERGRRMHSERQKRYRRRKNVTERCCIHLDAQPIVAAVPEAIHVETSEIEAQPETDGAIRRCGWCGRPCSPFMRKRFLNSPSYEEKPFYWASG